MDDNVNFPKHDSSDCTDAACSEISDDSVENGDYLSDTAVVDSLNADTVLMQKQNFIISVVISLVIGIIFIVDSTLVSDNLIRFSYVAFGIITIFLAVYHSSAVCAAVLFAYRLLYYSVFIQFSAKLHMTFGFCVIVALGVILFLYKRVKRAMIDENADADRANNYAANLKAVNVFSAVLSCILLPFSVYFSVFLNHQPPMGNWTSGGYTYEYADFRFTLPDNWHYASNSEVKKLFGYSYGENTGMTSSFENAILFYCYNIDNSETMSAELYNMRGVYSEEEILTLWKNSFEAEELDGVMYEIGDISTTIIADEIYSYFTMSYDFEDKTKIPYNVCYLVRCIDNYFINFVYVSSDDIDVETISEMFVAIEPSK